jgi:hypothetical protein
LRPNY